MCPQLMKCAAGDIVSSLTRLKNHAPELTFFVSIFMKLSQINNIKSRKVATFQNCEIFSNYYFSYVETLKPPCRTAIMIIQMLQNLMKITLNSEKTENTKSEQRQKN